MRWAASFPSGVAIVARGRGVVARHGDAGPELADFAPVRPAGAWGWSAPWRWQAAASRALGPADTALVTRLPLSTLGWWLAPLAAAAAGWAAGWPAWALPLASAAVRLAPWALGCARVAGGRPTAQQRMHAAEHVLTDQAGLVCGAQRLLLATALGLGVDLVAALVIGGGAAELGAARLTSALSTPLGPPGSARWLVWGCVALALASPTALAAAARAPGWLLRPLAPLAAAARPRPRARDVGLVAAAWWRLNARVDAAASSVASPVAPPVASPVAPPVATPVAPPARAP